MIFCTRGLSRLLAPRIASSVANFLGQTSSSRDLHAYSCDVSLMVATFRADFGAVETPSQASSLSSLSTSIPDKPNLCLTTCFSHHTQALKARPLVNHGHNLRFSLLATWVFVLHCIRLVEPGNGFPLCIVPISYLCMETPSCCTTTGLAACPVIISTTLITFYGGCLLKSTPSMLSERCVRHPARS